MLNASVLAPDPATNLQLALGVELAVLPPYLYALWSIKPCADGASIAAAEAANVLRAVAYEEMLHAGLVGNLLKALKVEPQVKAHLMTYPGPLPGHASTPPYGYDVGLAPLSPTAIKTFLLIERPDWDAPKNLGSDWITIGDLYNKVKRQLRERGSDTFCGEHQFPPADNPSPGRMIRVKDLKSALAAVDTVIDQGEGHRPKPRSKKLPPDLSYQSDDDHEVAHYYQFETLASYFDAGLIERERDLYPVIENPHAGLYTSTQQAANRRFNEVYTELIDSVQETLSSGAPRAFGGPTDLMRQLTQLAAVLRSAGTVPGTPSLAGPTFEYLA